MPFSIQETSLRYPVIRDQITDKIDDRNRRNDCLSPINLSTSSDDGAPEVAAMPLRLVRCRKCENCMKVRQRQWQYRGAVEFATHQRTWFVTLTWAPNNNCSYEDVKKYFKRLRKKRGAFRYLCTEEFGENGTKRKHWHILLHCSHNMSWRDVSNEWDHGHVHAKLAHGSGLASYVAKYAAKSGRIRASRFYGEESGCHHVKGWPTDDFDVFFKTGSKSDLLESIGVRATRWGIEFTNINALAEMCRKEFKYVDTVDDLPF